MKKEKSLLQFVKTRGFTLIELLVSVTIIFMLMMATAGSYDKLRSRNIIRTSGSIIRDCVMQAKSLALGPEIQARNIEYYSATIGAMNHSSDDHKNRCIIERKTNESETLTLVETIKLNPVIKIHTPLGYTENQYIFRPTKNGVAEVIGSLDFFLESDTNDCLNMKFIKESGELFLEDVGQINANLCL